MSSLTKKRTIASTFMLALFVILALETNASAGAPNGCLPATNTSQEMNRVIYQEFPARGPTETAWMITWTEFGSRGLWIENATFYPDGLNGISVLGQSGLSNIFVPYHAGFARLYDLNPYADLREALLSYAGPCGTISGPPLPSPSLASAGNNPPRAVLVKEIRDRGVAWTSDGHTRRGEELLLWSVSDSGNYEYIIQYGFRDDGTITFRLGSTGYNSPVRPYESHMHNGLWYVDVNVFAADHNSVSLMRHLEPAPFPSPSPNPLYQAIDTMTPFNGGVEGFADWNDKEFTGLNIHETLAQNSHGHYLSYDLMPMRTGTAIHDEPYSQHQFWVTRQPSVWTSELSYDSGLLSYINGQSIVDTDIVLWYMSSNHHHPRDEDHEFDQLGNLQTGVAQTMWSGFDLHPRNFFYDAPLHGCAYLTPYLVGWWPFEELNGLTTADIHIGTANHGTASQALGLGGPTPIKGAVGGAFSYDGVDDYVEVNHDASLNFGTGNFSADFWIKSSQFPFGVILDKRKNVGNAYTGYHFFLYDGKPGVQLANGVSYANYISNTVVADGYWHHVVVTVDRTSLISWYVDGKLLETTPTPFPGSLDNVAPLRFGTRSFDLSGFFQGAIGEFALFDRVLSPDDVYRLYTYGKCR